VGQDWIYHRNNNKEQLKREAERRREERRGEERRGEERRGEERRREEQGGREGRKLELELELEFQMGRSSRTRSCQSLRAVRLELPTLSINHPLTAAVLLSLLLQM